MCVYLNMHTYQLFSFDFSVVLYQKQESKEEEYDMKIGPLLILAFLLCYCFLLILIFVCMILERFSSLSCQRNHVRTCLVLFISSTLGPSFVRWVAVVGAGFCWSAVVVVVSVLSLMDLLFIILLSSFFYQYFFVHFLCCFFIFCSLSFFLPLLELLLLLSYFLPIKLSLGNLNAILYVHTDVHVYVHTYIYISRYKCI